MTRNIGGTGSDTTRDDTVSGRNSNPSGTKRAHDRGVMSMAGGGPALPTSAPSFPGS